MSEASVTPWAGGKMATMFPVAPEALKSINGIGRHLLQDAERQFEDLCSPHGLVPVDVKLEFRLTVWEMRRRGMDVADEMHDDLIVFGFSARAVTKPSVTVPAAEARP